MDVKWGQQELQPAKRDWNLHQSLMTPKSATLVTGGICRSNWSPSSGAELYPGQGSVGLPGVGVALCHAAVPSQSSEPEEQWQTPSGIDASCPALTCEHNENMAPASLLPSQSHTDTSRVPANPELCREGKWENSTSYTKSIQYKSTQSCKRAIIWEEQNEVLRELSTPAKPGMLWGSKDSFTLEKSIDILDIRYF